MRLVPRADGDRIEGVIDGALRARVTAPPVDGAANDALIRLVAAELGLSKSRVRLVAGVANRTKVLGIDGVEGAALRARWPGLDV
ncbi:MAG TPA: DUF167 domain-containing protein [Candidatus Limnocylindria bacterium]|nr:DUF167 domain-containing protein [Candidatus Limnocylindria bacterium]